MTVKYPNAHIKLVGEDGNAHSIMGRAMRALRSAGATDEAVNAYHTEATAGDYGDLLRTTMAWVSCDQPMKKETEHYTNYELSKCWDDVDVFLYDAKLIAWDTCHKIYLAMDDEQASWFTENYAPDIFKGTHDEMLQTLHKWYDASCGLKFIQAVSTDHEDPNAGYDTLIPQGASDRCDEEEDETETCYSCNRDVYVYADGMCERCWNEEEDPDEVEC